MADNFEKGSTCNCLFLCPCFLGCSFLFGTYTYIYIKEAYRPRGVYLLLSNGPLTESSSVTSAFAVAVSWWWFISFTVGGNFLDVRVKLIFYKYPCTLPTCTIEIINIITQSETIFFWFLVEILIHFKIYKLQHNFLHAQHRSVFLGKK